MAGKACNLAKLTCIEEQKVKIDQLESQKFLDRKVTRQTTAFIHFCGMFLVVLLQATDIVSWGLENYVVHKTTIIIAEIM